jgi:hypothetical protein
MATSTSAYDYSYLDDSPANSTKDARGKKSGTKAGHKPFRTVEVHKLHVTDAFLDELREILKRSAHYEVAIIMQWVAEVSLSDTHEIVIRSLETKEELHRYPSHHAYGCKRVAVWENEAAEHTHDDSSSNSKHHKQINVNKGHIVTMSSDSIKSRDLDNKLTRNFAGHKSKITSLLLSHEEAYEDVRIISGSAAGQILIHSLKTTKILLSLQDDIHRGPIVSLALTLGIGNIPLIASIDSKHVIALWEDDSESVNCLRVLGNT